MSLASKRLDGLSVVIPVRNEAENIPPLFQEIRAALRALPAYEVIFVDDGSTDDTARLIPQLASREEPVRLVQHQQSYGQSTALCTGVGVAKYSLIATLDGDGQNDPADLPKLLSLYLNADAVDLLICGYRRKRQDSWTKRCSSRVANGIRSRLLRDNTPDTGCGIKLFSKSTFQALPHFHHMHRFLPALIQRVGGQVVSVEVNHRPRTLGRSNYGVHNRLWAGIIDTLGVMWLLKRSRRAVIVPPAASHDS